MTCDCPTGPGVTITDPVRHAEWHALTATQTGPTQFTGYSDPRLVRAPKTTVDGEPLLLPYTAPRAATSMAMGSVERDADVTPARARRTDPGTSHQAARSLPLRYLRRSQHEVLALFRTHGPMTDEDVAGRAPAAGVRQSPSGLRTRRAELVDGGLLVDTGRTRRTASGRHTIVWALADSAG